MMATRRLPMSLLLSVAALALALTMPAPPAVAAPPSPRVEQAAATHAVAQEGEEHGEQEHAEEEEHEAEPKAWWYWPSKWINFLMLAALLYWLLVVPPPAVQEIFSFPGLRTIFIERAKGIIAARDLAAEQKEEAAQLLSQSEQRLAKIEEEVAALVADARRDAEREQERAIEDGKAQAQKIGQVAQREIKHERVAAQRQLRGFVADLAVNLAEKSLAEHLTVDDQDRLIREYLSRLGQSMA
jgi:F-type H+-transporting ATPase subunit b